MSDHGYHPLGKYSSARDDILHYLCINGWDTGEFGNVSDYGAYAWQITNEQAEVHRKNSEINSVLADWFKDNPEVTDSDELRAELEGWFIVWENGQGFVNVQSFDSEADLLETWHAEVTRYADWSEEQDED